MKWLVDFIQLVSFDQSGPDQGFIDVKMNKSNFDEKPSYDARVVVLL